jgi:hypothetical protein
VILITGLDGLQGCETSRFPCILQSRVADGGEFVSLPPRLLLTSRMISGTNLWERLSRPQSYIEVERITETSLDIYEAVVIKNTTCFNIKQEIILLMWCNFGFHSDFGIKIDGFGRA